METVYVQYQGHRPFIEAVVTDKDGFVKLKLVDSSIANLIGEVKKLFRGYNIEVQLPGVTDGQ